jgi:hypothetical protein
MERLRTLFFALGLLLLVAYLFFGQQAPPSPDKQILHSEARGDFGTSALLAVLQAQGIKASSYRKRGRELIDLPLEGKSLLVLQLPMHRPMLGTDTDALEEWVRKGNSVLILAYAQDGLASDDSVYSPLIWRWFERQLDPGDLSDEQKEIRTQRIAGLRDDVDTHWLNVNAELPGFADVGDVKVVSKVPMRKADVNWSDSGYGVLLRDSLQRPVLLARKLAPESEDEAEDAQVSEHLPETGKHSIDPKDSGWLFYSSYGSLFANQSLSEPGNLRLLHSLIGLTVEAKGQVLLGDHYQGLSAIYDPEAFFKDPRLWGSLGILLLLWLAYVIGINRRLLAIHDAPLRAPFLVEGYGNLLSRAVPAQERGVALLAAFFDSERRRRGLARGDADLWDELANDPRVAPKHLIALRQAATKPAELEALFRALQQVRGDLSHTQTDHSQA